MDRIAAGRRDLRTDGRLIAHPAKRAEILAGKGLLTAAGCGDPVLASLDHLVGARTERRFGGFDAATATYYRVARLSGPEWFYVTTMSRDRLRAQASASARWVLWTGLGSLALVLVVIAAILRRQVTRPLAKFAHATKALSASEQGVPLEVHERDELGALAGAFRERWTRSYRAKANCAS